MGKLIEADALLASLRESRDRANVWLSDCREYGSKMTVRAEQAVMTFNECILRVKGAPTVDAVPVKHGRWIIKDNPGTGWYRVTCSECGEDVTSVAPVIGFFPKAKVIWDFCPDCGAKMDGKDGDS